MGQLGKGTYVECMVMWHSDMTQDSIGADVDMWNEGKRDCASW